MIVPNFTANEIGERQSQVHGVRGVSNTNLGTQTAITYVDGVPVNDWRAANIELFDVESITARRGPQGETMYGASAEAGLFDIKTVQPSKEFHGDASVRYGNFNTQCYSAAVGGPVIKDKVLFRLNALESKRDGFLHNDVLGNPPDFRDDLAGRAQLLFLPAPEVEIKLTGQAQRANDGIRTFVPFDQIPSLKIDSDVQAHPHITSELAALNFTYHAPSFDLTSVTARRYWGVDGEQFDIDMTPRDIYRGFEDSHFAEWTQELRLSSTKNTHSWQWLAGAYYEDKRSDDALGTRIGETAFIQAAPPNGLGLPFTGPLFDRHAVHSFSRTGAIFGQATYTAWEKLDLTFGMRLESRDDLLQQHHRFSAPAQNVSAPLSGFTLDGKSQAALPKVALAWHVNPALMPYVTVCEGYRPRGFSHLDDDPLRAQWRQESLWNYEAGLKSAWLDDKVVFDLALFNQIAKQHQILRESVPGQFRLINAEQATMRGAEAEVEARPLSGLTLTANLGFLDAHFDKFFDQFKNARFDGNNIGLAAPYTASIRAAYRHHCGLFVQGEAFAIGRYALGSDNLQYQEGYQLINAKLGYERKNAGFYLYGNNLFDRRYSYFGSDRPVGGGQFGSPGEPRMFGVMAVIGF